MTVFVYQETVPVGQVITAALGDGIKVFKSATDIGKAMSLVSGAGANCNYDLAAAEADIDGFLWSVEPITVNQGYGLGAIQTSGWIRAIVGPSQGGTPMGVGDYVVADVQLAVGTPVPNNWPYLPSSSLTATYGNAPGTAPSFPGVPLAAVKTGVAGVPGTSFSTPLRKFWRVMRIVSGTGAAGSTVLLFKED